MQIKINFVGVDFKYRKTMIDFQNGSIYKLKKVDSARFNDELRPILVAGESVIGCYQDKRIIAVNVQGITGKKKDFTTLPYSKISVFSVETAGTFDLDSEIELYYSGVGKVRFEFRGASDILEISRVIAAFALR